MTADNIEDIYELSPAQQGILFHTLYTPASGMYLEQLRWIFQEPLDVSAFRRAWQRVLDRHPALRASFYWEDLDGLDKPLQIVHRQVILPLEEHDWHLLSLSEQETQLEAYLQADRQRGFDMATAPLMRLTLIYLSEVRTCLIWSFHHVLMDGWSYTLVLKEVFTFYEAFTQGQDLQMERPRAYSDYIGWLQQQDFSSAEAFWRPLLAGFTAPTPFGIDRMPLHQPDGKIDSSQQMLHLSAQATQALQAFARSHQLTLHTLVQGAWALLLSHYSREEDIVFGIASSGRPTDLLGVEAMVGLFINTLPVRVKVPSHMHLLPWLKEIQQQQAEMRHYEHCPLVQIQGWSQVPGGLPLFESLLVFENVATATSASQTQESGPQPEGFDYQGRTNYPLTILAIPGEKLLLRILYERSRFADADIQRTLARLCVLLEGICSSSTAHLCAVPLLTQEEQQFLLGDLNATQMDYPRNMCLHELVEMQAERTPDAVAVVGEEGHLTYRELNTRANQLAHTLLTFGIGPDLPVGMYMERSLEMAVALLGTLKAGGTCLPLDISYPRERLAFMLADAGVSVLLTKTSLREQLPAYKGQQICLDTPWETLPRLQPTSTRQAVQPDHLAYIIYTSGSTGIPKGVAMSHRSLVNLITWQLRTSSCTRNARTLQFAALSFDVAFQEIFSAWSTGNVLVLIAEPLRRDPAAMLHWLAFQAVEQLFLPFVALQQLAEASSSAGVPASLREVITAGEQLRVTPALRSFMSNVPLCSLHNHYGPSESHVVTTFSLAADPTNWPPLPPIGRPISNTQVYVLDAQLYPAPLGLPGELYLSGDALARGYLNQPALTAERFLPNPFAQQPGARFYRTGDLVRYQPDGDLEFLGRLDDQRKIRGYRVEPGEIEALLIQHPLVQETLVLDYEDRTGEMRLAAYIIANTAQIASAEDLRHFVKDRLPEYMLPSAFVFLNAWPLTPSGKVDRRALPLPEHDTFEHEDDYVSPSTPVEEVLAEIWAEILGWERVGVSDNFFELGGHSLLATRVTSRIREILQVELPVRALFDKPTIAGIVEIIMADQIMGEKAEKHANLLQSLILLSDDEVETMLEQER